MKYKIVVFAYDFPHMKSYDMLKIFHKLKLDPIVICAPFEVLKNRVNSHINFPLVESQQTLCKRYNFK